MINNIYCVGRNYTEHAKELGNNVEAEPIIFSKPNSSLITDGMATLPNFSDDIHFETEIVVKINKDGFQIDQQDAPSYYDEIAVGLDLTARDLQTKLKDKKLPWFLSKGFKDSCYVSPFVLKSSLPKDIMFHMTINNKERQRGSTKDMIFSIDQIIVYLSRFITLKKNDLIYTGTPKGVGKLYRGDEITLFLENKEIGKLKITI
ncbi:fumarylacetoacetate hydrolase family protein [Commensalibacter oyaizuii]|uniref:Fumarylacetoacetate hydrolase family protein n=1 Tax=Commensalibacter oyaizuii TaxID=3043873 RepID=A0ABT6PZQ6_9PROT|nr:fumarylacetoacetate hydrolase family protein [Commensalibacter sp. TBRC 16381]MDI2090350.1 fumarylacetoacetate hydrolase family protein [Commensalibacter sp. TBRC 16381]